VLVSSAAVGSLAYLCLVALNAEIAMVSFGQRIANLSPEHRALLELRMRDGAASANSEQAIPHRGDRGPCPLSFGQQRLWFLNQLEPDNPAYNQPKALRLSGALRTDLLRQALTALVDRHHVLRTRFTAVDGSPVQVVGAHRLVELPLIDLSDVPAAECEAELQRQIVAITQRPFDLALDLMLRAALFRLGAEEHLLLLVTHHIASDAWSKSILYQDLAAFYEALAAGKPAVLPALSIQYADFACWQRQLMQGESLQSQLAYWKQQLRDAPPMLELPTDRPRPGMPGHCGAREPVALPPALSQALGALSQREGTTLFMTLLAGFYVLLHRYTGQDDLVIGSPVAGRSRVETERLIGFFLNTLVLRIRLAGNPSFRELLQRVRAVTLDAYSHQSLPFEMLVEEMQAERLRSRSPLHQVTFTLRNIPAALPEISGLKIREVDIDSRTAKYDLTLLLTEDAGALRGWLEYDTDLFEAATIRRLLSHYQALLEGIVADPDRRLANLPLLTEVERQQLLVDWNCTEADYPKEACIHSLFEAQVERTPEAVAVVFAEQELTYRALNSRANQLAHYLRGLGVGPETRVGICLERSLAMVVGLLGILKAGGAYVPLDPEYPKERLAFLLEDSQVAVLLTQQRFRAELPAYPGPVVCLDAGWDLLAEQSTANVHFKVSAENLAYLIYTSGSTGTPKGVAIPHRGVVRLLFGVQYAELNSSHTFLQLSPLSFDASTFELWGSLLHGARCVLFPGRFPLPHDLGRVLAEYRVSTLWLTASLFNMVMDEAPDILQGIRQLLIGGEALSVSHVQRALERLPATQIINGYGPTESTTFTCCYPIPRTGGDFELSIPIGRPIAQTQVYVLDRHLQPVPVGVPGELYIGGAGLARGYLNQPELTAQRFLANPFGTEPGARLYRTGDRVRWRPDGCLEFLGRLDQQVKLRGFRIELGEIEAVLGQHPQVRQAVVLLREDRPGDPWLVAYLVPAAEARLTREDVRRFLGQKLPEYMLPAAVVFLAGLPRTSNGKLDRRALPAPQHESPALDAGERRPRTPVEERLAALWAETLGLEQVGLHENFFALGGHSLLATRVTSRVRQAFGVELPVRALFEAPTVAGLAVAVVEQLLAQAESSARAWPF
jgi:aspartate racemase